MAATRPRTQAHIGSARWLLDEREQADELVVQETEEFQFSVRNDMEWLNEHMADIFDRNHFDVAEAFKTPGKLRGKTPRTARRRGLEDRAPLTDVFAPTSQGLRSPSRTTPFMKKIAHFQVAEDKDNSHLEASVRKRQLSLGQGKENFDSGYHEMTDDELTTNGPDVGSVQPDAAPSKPQYMLSPPKPQLQRPRTAHASSPTQRTDSQDTFVSANEDARVGPGNNEAPTQNKTPQEERPQSDNEAEEGVPPSRAAPADGQVPRQSNQYSVSASTVAAMDDALDQVERESPSRPTENVNTVSPSSEVSSEHQPALRKKSSLNFASLPPRAPLTASKGTTHSRTSQMDQWHATGVSRNSEAVRRTLSRANADSSLDRLDIPQDEPLHGVEDRVMEDDDLEPIADQIQSQTDADEVAKTFGQTSTQRLQQRLALLGKSTAPRISKSIPSLAARPSFTEQKSTANHLAISAEDTASLGGNEEDDSWISPPDSSSKPIPPTKLTDLVVSTANVEGNSLSKSSPAESSSHSGLSKSKSQPLSYPDLPASSVVPGAQPTALGPKLDHDATRLRTEQDPQLHLPAISKHDGPLSASKAKLYSVFKSAKGIFANSASASAQAKMNTASPRIPVSKSQTSIRTIEPSVSDFVDQQVPVASKEQTGGNMFSTQNNGSTNKNKDLPEAPRRTSDRLKAVQMQVQNTVEQQSVRDEVVATRQTNVASSEQDFEATSENMHAPPSVPPKSEATQAQKHADIRRPGGRVTKEFPQKARPAPVNIRLRGFQGHGLGQLGAAGRPGPTQQEPIATEAPTKRPVLTKKASTSSMTSSAQSFKTTATSRPKALEAAAKKKEQDEREAQRKADQRRDVERRRAERIEEERKAEHDRKAAEHRAAEEKQQALRLAAEQRKADAIKRSEQLRAQAAIGPAEPRGRAGEHLSHALPIERLPPMASQQRNDLGARPISRLANNSEVPRPPLPHVNPAKPAKRQFDADAEDEHNSRSQAPSGPVGHPAAKRRRTSDDSFAEVISRPTMAPPVRPSMKRQDTAPRAIPMSFANTSSQVQQSQSIMKTAISNQHQIQHPKTPHVNDLAKFSNAKIPFADPKHAGPSSQQYPQTQRQPQQFKTPGTANTHKSSPQYTNGDNISLPEIATDSEDSDGEDDFVPPDWANSPALRELLSQQQLVDPMKVFGPIAPLMMEEVFKGNKERLAKFRKRTSSANWNGPDRLTEEERRKDRAAREKLEKEGAWTFGTPT